MDALLACGRALLAVCGGVLALGVSAVVWVVFWGTAFLAADLLAPVGRLITRIIGA
jgi:hypothetical protein